MKPTVAPLPHVVLLILLVAGLGGCAPPERFLQQHRGAVAHAAGDAEIPTGWRRTKHGWEDASRWFRPADYQQRSINGWIDQQRRREPGWMRRTLTQLRGTPPLMVAVVQIAAIAAILQISRWTKPTRPPSQPTGVSPRAPSQTAPP